MKKLIFALLFIYNSLLFAEQELSNLELSELTSVFNDELIELTSVMNNLENNLSNIEKSKYNSYDSAVKIAKEKDKKILLEVIVTKCKFCKQMEEKVLSKKSVEDAINRDFIFAQVNADRESLPLGLSEQMSPMFVFISKDETIIDIRFGYIEESSFLKILSEQSRK